MEIEQIIRLLNLTPLPQEGGLYAETYRSSENIPADALPGRYPRAGKPCSTAIYYLLTAEPPTFSALHRLPTDEVYHFYLGDPLEMTLLYPDGSHRVVMLGQDLLAGQQVQYVVPAGVWQGTRVAAGGRFALVGTTMAPGFTPEDYEHGDRDTLLALYPAARAHILEIGRAHV